MSQQARGLQFELGPVVEKLNDGPSVNGDLHWDARLSPNGCGKLQSILLRSCNYNERGGGYPIDHGLTETSALEDAHSLLQMTHHTVYSCR
jgi:hypothetical protein